MSLPNHLNFLVTLTDQITQPIAKISKGLNGLASNYQQNSMRIMSGAAGMAGAWLATANALKPAMEMDRALGEVKSLGVQQQALKMLADKSYDYALKYGRSATEFVDAAYQIQSGMVGDTGLTDKQLSNITYTAGITAAATKADATTITDYFATMYNIFATQADRIGKDAWSDKLGSYTALAVKNFKTDGMKLAQTFKTIGASATNAGASMGEQFAVLGLLGNTKDGSEAATKYVAFLRSAANAGKTLGMNFLDSNNNLLNTGAILEKIRGKFGPTMDAIEKMDLKKAFGTDEAVEFIDLLYNSTGNLQKQIEQFNNVKGLELAEKMAKDMTQQSDRLTQAWYVIRAAFGSAVLPVVNQFMGSVADMGEKVVWFTNTFPNITKVLGYTAMAIMGVVAAVGALTVVVGIFNIVSAALATLSVLASPIVLVVAAVVGLVAAVGYAMTHMDKMRAMLGDSDWGRGLLSFIDALSYAFEIVKVAAIGQFYALKQMFSSLAPILTPVLKLLGGLVVFIAGRLFKGIMLAAGTMIRVIANGIGFIAAVITGIANVVSAVADFMVASWTWVSDTYQSSTEAISQGFSYAWSVISAGWQALTALFDPNNWLSMLTSGAEIASKFMSNIFASLRESFGEVWGWIVDKLNMLPGVDIAVQQQLETVGYAQQAANDPIYQAMPTLATINGNSPYLQAPIATMAQPTTSEGLANVQQRISPRYNQQLASAAASRTSNTTHKTTTFGDVIVQNPPKDFNILGWADEQELAAG